VLTGDHEHFSNNLKLPHWASDKWCWECHADRKGHNTGLRFPEGASCCTRRDRDDELGERLSPHPVFTIPGVTRHSVAQDALHILFTKGVLSHALASCLHTMCWDGLGRQTVSPAHRLGALFTRVQQLYLERASPTRLTNLRLKMFVDPDRPHAAYPTLRAKGAETKHLLGIMAQIAEELSSPGSDHDLHRARLLSSISAFSDHMDACPMFPSEVQAAEARHHMQAFLKEAQWLKDRATAEGRMLWHIVPKHHMAEHMAEQFRFLNPRFVWTFRAEDFVGRVATLAHSVSFGTPARRLSTKIMEKYRLMLHIKYTRKIQEE
jgi:hypothetical protein